MLHQNYPGRRGGEVSHKSRFMGPFPGVFHLVGILWGPRTYFVKKVPNIVLISRNIWKVFDLKLFSAEEVNQKHQKNFFSLSNIDASMGT